jgi:hypothetical protein
MVILNSLCFIRIFLIALFYMNYVQAFTSQVDKHALK